MGSVTELSLLFISSNCWSMMSPASLSVSLLAQALWESAEKNNQREEMLAVEVCSRFRANPLLKKSLVLSASLRLGHLCPPQHSCSLLPFDVQGFSRRTLGGCFWPLPPLGCELYRKELCWSQYCTPCVSELNDCLLKEQRHLPCLWWAGWVLFPEQNSAELWLCGNSPGMSSSPFHSRNSN